MRNPIIYLILVSNGAIPQWGTLEQKSEDSEVSLSKNRVKIGSESFFKGQRSESQRSKLSNIFLYTLLSVFKSRGGSRQENARDNLREYNLAGQDEAGFGDRGTP